MTNNQTAKDRIFERISQSLDQYAVSGERVQTIRDLSPEPFKPYAPTTRNLSNQKLIELLTANLTQQSAEVYIIENKAEIPKKCREFLQSDPENLTLHTGQDSIISTLNWQEEGIHLTQEVPVLEGAISLSHCFAAASETGTLFFRSGADNPARNNYLSHTHIALINAENIVHTYEEAWGTLKTNEPYLPRAIMMVSGPSRTADIEQTLILGAHGPVNLIAIIYR